MTMINVKMMLLSHFIFLKGGEIKIQFLKINESEKVLHQKRRPNCVLLDLGKP